MNAPAPKVSFVSLGCPKALVDSERIITQLRAQGYQTLRESVVPDVDQRLKLTLTGTAKTPAPNATPYHRFD